MPRHSTQQEDDIVFEDLHGVSEEENLSVEVDLDSDDKDVGISRVSRTSSDDGYATGDDDDDDADTSSKSRDGDDDDDVDGRGEQDKFSSKFQKRLQREQRQKRQARKEAEEAKAEAARLRRQLEKQKKSGSTDGDAQLRSQIEAAEADLEQAIEDGDSKKQVRLSSQLTTLKAEQIAARYTQTDDDDDDLDDRSASAPPRNELVEEWLDKHSDWYGQRGFSRLTRVAKTIDQELYKEGYDPRDDEYYEELDARMQERVPELFDENGDPDPDGMDARKGSRSRRGDSGSRADKRSRSTVASADDASRDSARTRRDSSKIELGPEDFANMRRFGLDPKNPAQIKEYALNKRQVAMEEANG